NERQTILAIPREAVVADRSPDQQTARLRLDGQLDRSPFPLSGIRPIRQQPLPILLGFEANPLVRRTKGSTFPKGSPRIPTGVHVADRPASTSSHGFTSHELPTKIE